MINPLVLVAHVGARFVIVCTVKYTLYSGIETELNWSCVFIVDFFFF